MHTVPMLVLSHFYFFTHTCMWYTYIASCRPWSVHWYVFMYIIIIILQLDAFYIIYISPLCVRVGEQPWTARCSVAMRKLFRLWSLPPLLAAKTNWTDQCIHLASYINCSIVWWIIIQYCTVPSVSEYNYISIYVRSNVTPGPCINYRPYNWVRYEPV